MDTEAQKIEAELDAFLTDFQKESAVVQTDIERSLKKLDEDLMLLEKDTKAGI